MRDQKELDLFKNIFNKCIIPNPILNKKYEWLNKNEWCIFKNGEFNKINSKFGDLKNGLPWINLIP